MNPIDRSAKAIAQYIKANYPESASVEVLYFSLVPIINTSISILISLIISWILGNIIPLIMVFIAFMLLRTFSGGVHFRSSLVCCFTSAFTLTLAANIQIAYWPAGFSLDIVSLLLVLLYSPSGLEELKWFDKKKYPLFKAISVLIVLSNFWIQSPLLSMAFIAQTITIPKLAFRFVQRVEGKFYPENKQA